MGNLNKSDNFSTFVKKHHSVPVYQQDLADMQEYKVRLVDYFVYGKDKDGKPLSAANIQKIWEEIRRTDAWLKLAAEKFINNNNTKIDC